MNMLLEKSVTAKLDKIAELFAQKFNQDEIQQLDLLANLFSRVISKSEFERRDAVDLYGMIVSYWQFIRHFDGKPLARVYNAEYERSGWTSQHTVIEVLIKDSPFIVDTLVMLMSSMDIGIHFIMNAGAICTERDEQGKLLAIDYCSTKSKGQQEAMIIMEVDRQDDDLEGLQKIKDAVLNVYAQLSLVVSDFQPMKSLVSDVLSNQMKGPSFSKNDVDFVTYLENNHFIFLGVAEIDAQALLADHDVVYRQKKGLFELNQLFVEKDIPLYLHHLTGKKHYAVNVFKSSYSSPVHRPAHIDLILITKYDDNGNVDGLYVVSGLFTATVYHSSVMSIPFVASRVEDILVKTGFTVGGHSYKTVLNIIETLPRDELFLASDETLFATVMGIFHIRERQVLKLFIHRDQLSRYAYCMVYMPRERYNSTVRERIETILCEAFNASHSTFKTNFFDGVLCRIDFKLYTNGTLPSELDIHLIEEQLVEVEKSWTDNLLEDLVKKYGENKGRNYFNQYKNAFSPAYQHDYITRQAVADINHFIQLDNNPQHLSMAFYHLLEESQDRIRLKMYLKGKTIELSTILPLLENLGMRVIEEKPYVIKPHQGKNIWLSDFGLCLNKNIDLDAMAPLLEDAVYNMWAGVAENDRFNYLIIGSELNWRQVTVIRAISKYLMQTGLRFSQKYIEDTYLEYGNIVKNIIKLFDARFNPTRNQACRDSDVEKLKEIIIDQLSQVTSLDQDKILRRSFEVVNAVVRTNFFQRNVDGGYKSYVALKLQPRMISDMPKPVPMFETFMYSPRVEGVHLRGSKVARGGLRWSDRKEDYRTEVLGLVKAQQVKNAVIVPQGAKGGFIPKYLPVAGGRAEQVNEAIACYKLFISSLLDLADNIKNGEIVKPENVVCYDGDDPYIVVAADKGTATFSDIANSVSAQYDFWLGDAFASGGSNGYDHKKMGITARGGWESVKRHFKGLGKDIQNEDFTVVGIGDMAGDVFGNGMLLSKHICLQAAFNHMHIFIDPTPDSASSYKERKRLFELSGSSWEDYNQELISKGGGIFKRSAKSIKLTPEMKEMLDTNEDSLEPSALIKLILKMRVELLWNGGIGTYVKSQTETNEQVGDRANDSLRINGSDLRCQVVGEGGNLGFTQLGRIEYAQNGGCINTDAIDNSAGVDCSDHEVNIKILLNSVVESGKLSESARNDLLAQMSDEVAELVLDNNRAQTKAIAASIHNQSSYVLESYSRLMRKLESKVQLDREVEFLPSDQVLQQRKIAKLGLTSPEFSVVMAYTKIMIKEQILKSSLPEDPYFLPFLKAEFPKVLAERYLDEMKSHKLAREIIATQLTNILVMRTGVTFVQRIYDETGASVDTIIKAYMAAIEIFNIQNVWDQIALNEHVITAEGEQGLLDAIYTMVRRAARWLIRHEDMSSLSITELADKYRDDIASAMSAINDLLTADDHARMKRHVSRFMEQGVPEALAKEVVMIKLAKSVFDLVKSLEICKDKAQFIKLAKLVNHKFLISWFRYNVNRLNNETYWAALATSALRDDLDYVQFALVNTILGQADQADDEKTMLEKWVNENYSYVSHWRDILQEIKSAEPRFDSITVAFKALRSIIQY